MNRKIPTTMVSQHPDHAQAPVWKKDAFISTQDEMIEAMYAFSTLGVDEYKWDWEGKFVDEAVMERLLGDNFAYFQKHPLGKEKFLTFRLPNPKVEHEFRIGRAFMGIVSAASLAKQVGFPNPPLFEVILPMTETAEELLDIHEAFAELTNLKHPLYRLDKNGLRHLMLIPLFEQVETIINSDAILEKYLKLHKQKLGFTPSYIRPYIARSDPALNSGLVPTVLALKIALSRFKDFEKKHKIPLYPVIGSASLPFRGGLTPFTVEQFVSTYKGVRTALLQSAFRYDYKEKDVKKAIRLLDELLPKTKADTIDLTGQKALQKMIPFFEMPFRESVESLASVINDVASKLPRRRERVQHVGLFGYSRGVGKVKLPRAIGFTASLYSLGIPPELIGTGRGLRSVQDQGKGELLETYYPTLRLDLLQAGKFLHKDIVKLNAKRSKVWKEVAEDIKEIEAFLGVELGPKTVEEKEHHLLVEKIYTALKKKKPLTHLLEEAAKARKSLG